MPAAPGVYQFEDDHGTVLYVGKSVNLRRRVRGYFYGGGPRNERLAEMLVLAKQVGITPTGSDLEARLEEAERIVHGRPRYNRALKNRSRGWYVEINWADPYPRLRVVRSVRRPMAQYFGPFRGRSVPAAIARLAEKVFMLRSCAGNLRPDPSSSPCLQHGLGLCSAPCAGRAGLNGYREQVRAAARSFGDREYVGHLRERLVTRRDESSESLDFESAAEDQCRIDWLDELESYRSAIEGPDVRRSWLLVLPHVQSERRMLVPVARGRVLKRKELRWEDRDWPATIENVCYSVRLQELRAESVFPPAELVTSLIVSGWLDSGAPGGLALDLDRHDTDQVVAALSPLARDGSARAPTRPAAMR